MILFGKVQSLYRKVFVLFHFMLSFKGVNDAIQFGVRFACCYTIRLFACLFCCSAFCLLFCCSDSFLLIVLWPVAVLFACCLAVMLFCFVCVVVNCSDFCFVVCEMVCCS